MKRAAVLSAFVLVAVVLVAVFLASPSEALAASARPGGQMIVFLADGAAVRHHEQGDDLTMSLIGLVATLQADVGIMFMDVDDPSDTLGPFNARAPDFEGIQDTIRDRLSRRSLGSHWGMVDALVEAQEALVANRAAAGSKVYLLTGNSPVGRFEGLSRRLVTFVGQLGENEWAIHGVGLPGARPDVTEFLEIVSEGSGGQAFDLSVSDGFREVADMILAEGAKGSLDELGRRVLANNELMTSVVGIAPGTRETTILLIREDADGSLRLNNPSGFEVSAGDRTESYVVELPHVVIWRLVDPVPGEWTVNARRMEGLIAAWQYSSNKYSLVLGATAPVPVEKATTLVGYVTDGEHAVVLEGARLFAEITTPDGSTTVREMRDDGTLGDSIGGDGNFSLVLPPLVVEGEYGVELELSWPEDDYRISSHTTFEARPFPKIEVTPVELDELRPGERTHVATLLIHVEGQPYPVPVEQLTASLRGPRPEVGTLELVPRLLFEDGPAWEYEAFVTAEESGYYTQVFSLSLEYAGRPYTHTSEAQVLSTVAPLAPAEPVAAPFVPVPPAPAPEQTQVLPPPPQPAVEPAGFPRGVAVTIVVLLAGVIAAAVHVVSRPRPYGYLYDDSDEPVVDFSKVKRHPLLALLSRGSVSGKDLNIPGLEGVVFYFTRSGIRLRNSRKQPSVRVNNEPLMGQATLQDRTWIGARGKLFTFTLSPSEEGAGAD